MNNGKQSEQLLKVLGGHSASLDRTSKCRGLSEQPLYSGGHKAMQHETRNWNNFDKCEPEQQYRLRLLAVQVKIILNLQYISNTPNIFTDSKGNLFLIAPFPDRCLLVPS